MAVITDIANLSQNAAFNGPDGAVDPPSTLDDQIRYNGSFIAKLRDGVGFSAGAITSSLGFTPVRQGGGTGQGSNIVRIGWSTVGSNLLLQVDASNFGATWPIGISGNAQSATNAVNAVAAGNANTVGGINPVEFVRRNTGNAMGLTWDGVNGWVYPTVDGTVQSSYTLWEKIPNRPTDLGQFGNSPGYQTSGQLTGYAVQKEVSVRGLGNIGVTGAYIRLNDNSTLSWGTTISDARLKENIRAAEQDSLAKVRRLAFKAFNFKEGCDDGHEHKLGLIAQDIEAIDPELVDSSGTWKQPRVWEMLCVALHSIQQQDEVIAEMSRRLAALEGQA